MTQRKDYSYIYHLRQGHNIYADSLIKSQYNRSVNTIQMGFEVHHIFNGWLKNNATHAFGSVTMKMSPCCVNLFCFNSTSHNITKTVIQPIGSTATESRYIYCNQLPYLKSVTRNVLHFIFREVIQLSILFTVCVPLAALVLSKKEIIKLISNNNGFQR